MLGHTAEMDFADTERTPKNLREVEAEAVALLCCEALNLAGADYCRGYIQNWLYPMVGYNGQGIPEKSAQKIFHAADRILRAGRLLTEQKTNEKRQNQMGQASAQRLVAQGLAGYPPPEIQEELKNLYEDINFNHHLKLQGITLSKNQCCKPPAITPTSY